MMDTLLNLIMVIISQCVCVYAKPLHCTPLMCNFWGASYTSIKLGGGGKVKENAIERARSIGAVASSATSHGSLLPPPVSLPCPSLLSRPSGYIPYQRQTMCLCLSLCFQGNLGQGTNCLFSSKIVQLDRIYSLDFSYSQPSSL